MTGDGMVEAAVAPAGAVRAPSSSAPGSGRLAFAARTTGELLITAGVLVLLFVAYLLYWTDLLNARTQSHLATDLHRQWSAPDTATVQQVQSTGGVDTLGVPLGSSFGEIFIPRLGSDYHKVMVEGTDTADLDMGPGHYAGTAYPGQVGNFSVAGHRTTYGKPFNRLAEVRTGDHVVIETRSAWVTYVVTGETIVPADPATDGAAITVDPPAIGDQKGSRKLLTFTTCNPEYSATQRLILRGIWVSTDVKRAGYRPAALRPGAV